MEVGGGIGEGSNRCEKGLNGLKELAIAQERREDLVRPARPCGLGRIGQVMNMPTSFMW